MEKTLSDRSDVISEVPKCSKKPQNLLGKLTALPSPLAGGDGTRCPPAKEPHRPLSPYWASSFDPSGLASMGLTNYRVGNPNCNAEIQVTVHYIFANS